MGGAAIPRGWKTGIGHGQIAKVFWPGRKPAGVYGGLLIRFTHRLTLHLGVFSSLRAAQCRQFWIHRYCAPLAGRTVDSSGRAGGDFPRCAARLWHPRPKWRATGLVRSGPDPATATD